MLQPLRDIIAVIPLEDKKKIGSLYVPDTAQQKTDQGIILYRGKECKTLRVGDHVFFSGYTGTKVTIEPQGELIFMREVDVFFYDDGKPAEMMLPRPLVLSMYEDAIARIRQEIGYEVGGEHDMRIAVLEEIAAKVRDDINDRLTKGLEF